MKLSLITIVAFLTISVVETIHAQTPRHKRSAMPDSKGTSNDNADDIRRLLELIGANNRGEQLWRQMLPMMKQAVPQVSDAEWQEIDKEFSAELTSGKFVDMIVSIYRAHLTREDVKQLIAFYESPIGKKLISVTPKIAQEAMIAGQQRGQEIVKRVYEKLRKKGYSVPIA